jgi:CspA family cold shock protein
MDGFKTLKEGARVRFELVQGPKGLQALHIQQVGDDAKAVAAAAQEVAAPSATPQPTPTSEATGA